MVPREYSIGPLAELHNLEEDEYWQKHVPENTKIAYLIKVRDLVTKLLDELGD